MASPMALRMSRRGGKGSLLELQRALEAEAAGAFLQSVPASCHVPGGYAQDDRATTRPSSPPWDGMATQDPGGGEGMRNSSDVSSFHPPLSLSCLEFHPGLLSSPPPSSSLSLPPLKHALPAPPPPPMTMTRTMFSSQDPRTRLPLRHLSSALHHARSDAPSSPHNHRPSTTSHQTAWGETNDGMRAPNGHIPDSRQRPADSVRGLASTMPVGGALGLRVNKEVQWISGSHDAEQRAGTGQHTRAANGRRSPPRERPASVIGLGRGGAANLPLPKEGPASVASLRRSGSPFSAERPASATELHHVSPGSHQKYGSPLASPSHGGGHAVWTKQPLDYAGARRREDERDRREREGMDLAGVRAGIQRALSEQKSRECEVLMEALRVAKQDNRGLVSQLNQQGQVLGSWA